jgi:hypothetical protein
MICVFTFFTNCFQPASHMKLPEGSRTELISWILILIVPSGKQTKSYWKWWFIVDLPINSMVSFHSYVSLPEGISCPLNHAGVGLSQLLCQHWILDCNDLDHPRTQMEGKSTENNSLMSHLCLCSLCSVFFGYIALPEKLSKKNKWLIILSHWKSSSIIKHDHNNNYYHHQNPSIIKNHQESSNISII